MPKPAWEWDYEYAPRWRRMLESGWRIARRPTRALLIAIVVISLGMQVTAGSDAPISILQLRERVSFVENALTARRGELELARLELKRLNAIVDFSSRYRIPADLAGRVYDAAVAEGIEPALAFQLVWVESEFYPRAVSPVGAVGLTQVMPATAYLMNPRLKYDDLFDPETNLRLGFRYLRYMLQKYDGDLRLALLAYNRGPGRVDEIREAGGNPGNGYDKAVLEGI